MSVIVLARAAKTGKMLLSYKSNDFADGACIGEADAPSPQLEVSRVVVRKTEFELSKEGVPWAYVRA